MWLKGCKCVFACLIALSLCDGRLCASASEAKEGPAAEKSENARLESLLSRIRDLEAQLEALKKDVRSEVESAGPSPQPASDAATSVAQSEPASQRPNYPEPNRTHGTRGVNVAGVQVGGYGSVRFEANDTGGRSFVPGGSAKGFTFRRFVLTTDAQPHNRLRIYTETEFERLFAIEASREAKSENGGLKFTQELEGHGEISVEQAWAQFDFARNHGFRFGVVLPPVGRFNINHDDDYWDVPRRSLTDRDAPVLPVKSAWRELGAGFVGHTSVGAGGRLDYTVYFLGGATLDFAMEEVAQTRSPARNKLEFETELGLTSGAFDGTKNARAVGYRFAYSPRLGSEIAFSGYHGKYTPSFFSISENVHSFGVDGMLKRKGFQLEGEFIASSFGDVRRVVRNFASRAFSSSAETSRSEALELESEIEFELSSLARRRYGFWTDFKYYWRPGFLKNTFLGRGFDDAVLIPILRYERVWLRDLITDLEFQGGVVTKLDQEHRTQERIAAGLSYRPIPSFALQLLYERNNRREGSSLIFPSLPLGATNGFLFGIAFGF